MGRFDDITVEKFQELREQTNGGIPRERVLAAIGPKQGDQIDTLAERLGVGKGTVHNAIEDNTQVVNSDRLSIPTERERRRDVVREY